MHQAAACALSLLLLLAACGQRGMLRASGQMRAHMLAQDYAAALAALQQAKRRNYREQDRVVYWLEEGFLLHLVGRYRESNEALEAAERRCEELFTTSLRKSLKAAFTSDAALDYAGEDYEKVLINVVRALNYLALGEVSEALVEARKINDKLKLYSSKYEHPNRYNQDAFAHWLAGMLFEIEGSYDDARISLEMSLETYERAFGEHFGLGPPPFVAHDLVRVAREAGDAELAKRYATKYGLEGSTALPGNPATAAARRADGEVVLVHFNGEGPSKSDLFITCWFRSAQAWACDAEPGGEFLARTRIDVPPDGTVIKVAFPELHLREPAPAPLLMEVAGAKARAVPAYPLNAIAAKTMADKMRRVFRNAVIRVITKVASQKAAGAAGKEAGGRLAGWLAETTASVTMQAAEEADKRAWTTLPARIDIARAIVPPGEHALVVTLPNGQRTALAPVKVGPGKRVFVTVRSLL